MKSCCRDVFENEPPEPPKPRRSLRSWLKRLGVAGFAFFLIKGLLWLLVLWGGVEMFSCN